MRRIIFFLTAIGIFVYCISCDDTLNPVNNVYKSLTGHHTFVSVDSSRTLNIKFLKYQDRGALKRAIVDITLPDERIMKLVTDTSGIASVTFGTVDIPEGNCLAEICYKGPDGEYYGSFIFYLTGYMNSTMSLYVNSGECQKKFIKSF